MGFLTGIGGGLAKAGAWLLKNPAIIFAAAFSVAFILVVVSKNAEISTLEKASDKKDDVIKSMTSDLAVSRANAATLTASLQTQNASIIALKNQGDAASVKFDQIIAGMTTANATTAKKLDMLDKAKPGADKCASAFDLVRSSLP